MGYPIIAGEYIGVSDWAFALLLASIIPACLFILAGAWREPMFLSLALMQGSVIVVFARRVYHFLRQRGYSKITASTLAYFPVCIATNALCLLGGLLLGHLFG